MIDYKGTAVEDLYETALNIYSKGWAERNGGNISCLLSEEELAAIADKAGVIRKIPLGLRLPALEGKIFLATGTGKYFKNMKKSPETCMGIVRICGGGTEGELLWGLNDGGNFTSELASHLYSHDARLKQDKNHKVIVHTHPTNLISMTFVHKMNEKDFTNTLWKMCTECLLVFPDGIGVIPWMISANNAIGKLTAEKMEEHRLVVWGQHGIYGSGENFDEALGLIETAEKAAEIYLKIRQFPIEESIGDGDLKDLAEAYRLSFRADYLDLGTTEKIYGCKKSS